MAGGAVAGMLSFVACGGGAEARAPVAVMQVNCDDNPKDISVINFHHRELQSYGGRPVPIEIGDQRENKIVTVVLMGRTAVNGRTTQYDEAGEVVATLPTADLIAGLPRPNTDEYYAGNKGLTLACHGAAPSDADPA